MILVYKLVESPARNDLRTILCTQDFSEGTFLFFIDVFLREDRPDEQVGQQLEAKVDVFIKYAGGNHDALERAIRVDCAANRLDRVCNLK